MAGHSHQILTVRTESKQLISCNNTWLGAVFVPLALHTNYPQCKQRVRGPKSNQGLAGSFPIFVNNINGRLLVYHVMSWPAVSRTNIDEPVTFIVFRSSGKMLDVACSYKIRTIYTSSQDVVVVCSYKILTICTSSQDVVALETLGKTDGQAD